MPSSSPRPPPRRPEDRPPLPTEDMSPSLRAQAEAMPRFLRLRESFQDAPAEELWDALTAHGNDVDSAAAALSRRHRRGAAGEEAAEAEAEEEASTREEAEAAENAEAEVDRTAASRGAAPADDEVEFDFVSSALPPRPDVLTDSCDDPRPRLDAAAGNASCFDLGASSHSDSDASFHSLDGGGGGGAERKKTGRGAKLKELGGGAAANAKLGGAKIKDEGRKAWVALGRNLQKINFASLCDEVEHDGGVAAATEEIHRESEEEKERLEMVRQAELACMEEMKDHLQDFRRRRGRSATYESWVASLHPENYKEGGVPAELLEAAAAAEAEAEAEEEDAKARAEEGELDVQFLTKAAKQIDHRFYVDQSDHRRMWNESLDLGAEDWGFVHPRHTVDGSVLAHPGSTAATAAAGEGPVGRKESQEESRKAA